MNLSLYSYRNHRYLYKGLTEFAQFEWENKVAVATPIKDLRAYLDHLQKSTNMMCLTPEAALSGECDFLSANLSARSVFGEDALANVSLEKAEDGSISGHVRIRSKTQGIALSLGDKVCFLDSTVLVEIDVVT